VCHEQFIVYRCIHLVHNNCSIFIIFYKIWNVHRLTYVGYVFFLPSNYRNKLLLVLSWTVFQVSQNFVLECGIQLDVMVLLNVFIFWAFSCWTDSWYTHIFHFTRDLSTCIKLSGILTVLSMTCNGWTPGIYRCTDFCHCIFFWSRLLNIWN